MQNRESALRNQRKGKHVEVTLDLEHLANMEKVEITGVGSDRLITDRFTGKSYLEEYKYGGTPLTKKQKETKAACERAGITYKVTRRKGSNADFMGIPEELWP